MIFLGGNALVLLCRVNIESVFIVRILMPFNTYPKNKCIFYISLKKY